MNISSIKAFRNPIRRYKNNKAVNKKLDIPNINRKLSDVYGKYDIGLASFKICYINFIDI